MRPAPTSCGLQPVPTWWWATRVFAEEDHVPFEVTWLVYQHIITAYAHPDPREGGRLLARVIDGLRAAVPAGLDELVTLGRTLQRRRNDVLAYFTHRASNGPTEAIRSVEGLLSSGSPAGQSRRTVDKDQFDRWRHLAPVGRTPTAG